MKLSREVITLLSVFLLMNIVGALVNEYPHKDENLLNQENSSDVQGPKSDAETIVVEESSAEGKENSEEITDEPKRCPCADKTGADNHSGENEKENSKETDSGKDKSENIEINKSNSENNEGEENLETVDIEAAEIESGEKENKETESDFESGIEKVLGQAELIGIGIKDYIAPGDTFTFSPLDS